MKSKDDPIKVPLTLSRVLHFTKGMGYFLREGRSSGHLLSAVRMFGLILSLLLMVPATVLSEIEQNVPFNEMQDIEHSGFSAGLRMVCSLMVVLALILGGVFLLRKLNLFKGFMPGAEHPISVISNISLGHRRSICLVKIANEILVIGLTNTGMSLLSKMSTNEYYTAQADTGKLDLQSKQGEFHSVYLKNLRKFLKR